jgi:ribosomal protein S18 acetylase RimI-like enzyme
MPIRPMRAHDRAQMISVLDQLELFPATMLDDLAAPFLAGNDQEHWLVSEDGGRIEGFCFTRSETLADRVWNLLAIGVTPSQQRKGIAFSLTVNLENVLRERGQRLLIVDTSSTEPFAAARSLYLRLGYEQEARIRDFWADGDDKITFRKPLI